MGTIVVTTNSSLDGIVQDPDGEEGFARGGWFDTYAGDDRPAWAEHETAESMSAAAMLLGRVSDEWFASRWNERTGEWADKLNSLPKYVVSSTSEEPQWRNSTAVTGDVVAEITRIKEEVDGEILVYASYALVRTLLEHDLVDEIRLVVFPVVVGDGERLFGGTSEVKPMRLLDVSRLGEGLTYVSYELVR